MSRFALPVMACLVLLLGGCAPQRAAGNGLEYSGPTEQTVERGDRLPGTNIEFEGTRPTGPRC